MTFEAIPRLITIGETMMMVAPARAESLATAQDVRLYVGGAESNVACHAAHAGLSSAWVGVVGDDDLGHRICRSIESYGFDTRWVTCDPAAPTGVYFKDPGNGVLTTAAGRPHPKGALPRSRASP
jgi:2-dehydro-3-deoxygluconokinase